MFELIYALLVIVGTQVPGYVFWLRGKKQNHYSTRFFGLTLTLYLFLFLVLVGCLLINDLIVESLPCGVIWLCFYCCIPAFILMTYRTLLFVGMYRVHNKVVIVDIVDRFLNRAVKKQATLNRNQELLSRKNIMKIGWRQYSIVISIALLALFGMFFIGLLIVGPKELVKYPTESFCDYKMSIVLVVFLVLFFTIQGYCVYLLRSCKDGLGISLELIFMIIITLPSYFLFALLVLISHDNLGVQNASYIGLIPTYVLMSSIIYFPKIFQLISNYKVKEQSKSYQYPYFEIAFKNPDTRMKMEEIARKRLCSELMNFMRAFDGLEKVYMDSGATRTYKEIGQIIISKYLQDYSEEQVCLNEDVVVPITQVEPDAQIPFEYWLVAKKDVLYMIYENIYKYYVDN